MKVRNIATRKTLHHWSKILYYSKIILSVAIWSVQERWRRNSYDSAQDFICNNQQRNPLQFLQWVVSPFFGNLTRSPYTHVGFPFSSRPSSRMQVVRQLWQWCLFPY